VLKWKKEVELQSGQKLKVLRLDNTKEFKAFENELLSEYSIMIE
jgi:hypothetical protein